MQGSIGRGYFEREHNEADSKLACNIEDGFGRRAGANTKNGGRLSCIKDW